VYKYEDREFKKIPRNWMRIEYYTDLFKLSTYKIFFMFLGLIFGLGLYRKLD
jgi:hypothetical protein